MPEPAPKPIRLAATFAGPVAPLGPGAVPSAFVKHNVTGPVLAHAQGLGDDEQADRAVHGGIDKAIYAYPADTYAAWREDFPGHGALWQPGALGENLALTGCNETSVCIGDVVRLGEATLEVAQPRKPCFKLALRFADLRLPKAMVDTGRCGWYYRVLHAGMVQAGDELTLLARPNPEWSIRRVNDVSYDTNAGLAALRALSALPALSPAWRGQVETLIRSAEATGLEARFRPFRVAALHDEARGIRSLMLEPTDGLGLPTARPGQHVVVRVPAEAGAPARPRSYSLSDVGTGRAYRITVKREAGASAWLHDHLRESDTLELLGPRGAFHLDRSGDHPVLLISAGVGITPLIAMLTAATTNNGGAAVPRRIIMMHGARNRSEMAFGPALRSIAARHPAVELHIRLSAPGPGEPLLLHETAGRIDAALVTSVMKGHEDGTAYLCGPTAFMRDAMGWLVAAGLPPDRIRTESFEGASLGPASVQESEVLFDMSGHRHKWQAGGPSLLDIASMSGVGVESDCRVGLCGLCATRVLEGEIVYDQPPLAPVPSGHALLCCGQPASGRTILAL